MMRFLPLCTVLAASLLSAAFVHPADHSALQVAVTGGVVQGSAVQNAIVFRGIPYAAPPLGDLRWRAPVAVLPWQGVRADRADIPACPQNDQAWNHNAATHYDEDCLTLDVRTPALTAKLPVLVWIHGGSNFSGDASGTVLSRITDRGVVLVAIQYRLGLLGFLAPREAAAEAGGHAGNYGLMDQIAALRWIQANIAKFGGDPANVTIAGQSAGGEDVSLLLAAPAARGLFARAIMESGTPSFGMKPRTLAEALALGDQAVGLLGGSLAEMRRRPVSELLATDLKLHDPELMDDDFRWLRAQIDGAVLPRAPRDLLAEAPVRPVLLGSNKVEFGPKKGTTDWDKDLPRIFGANAAKARPFYLGAEPDARLGYPDILFWTDWMFRCPAGRMAELLSAKGVPVWRYEFDLGREGQLAEHSAEIGRVMKQWPFGPGVSLQTYWTNFAKTGDPNGGTQPEWPRFEPQAQRHILFDDRGVTQDAKLREPICSMLEEL